DVIKLDSLQLAFKNTVEDTSKIKTLLEISNYYSSSNYLKAIEYAQQARLLAVENSLEKFEAKAYVSMGVISLHQGDYKNASTYFFKALKYYEEAHDTISYLTVANNLGATYDRLGEFDKALTHYFQAQELLNKQPASARKDAFLPALFNNIANIYQSKGDPQSALKYYEKALSLALKVPKHRTQGQAYNNIGKLYLMDLNQPAKALEYLTKGLEVREQIGDQGEIARSLVILSNYFFRQKNYDEGKKYALRALTIGKEIGSLDIQMHAYESLSEIESGLGSYQQSLESYTSFKKLNDSLQVQQANSEMTRLQLQYDFEKAEKQREEEARLSRQRYITTIVVLSFSLIVVILITITIRSRARQSELKRKNLAQDIEIKNKELTTNVMYLIRKNELINNVAERLLNVQSNVPAENQKVVHDIILDLQKEADSDTWKEFELRFNQVHSDFYNKLRKFYPGLSPADEKLCAFLRLNMSSKEIAAITQQSIKSVEVARARLRKKLNLTNTTSNLITHLANI
ncbi:MAG: tetratricopeptide repeat protein, partial [Flammeovirgaceae bacterium]|nr:tetratricopeptide repeat protein [Flammeovirgaceae bacterium]